MVKYAMSKEKPYRETGQKPLEVQLIKHPVLDHIANTIQNTPLNFDLLLRKLERTRHRVQGPLTPEYVKGLMIEYYLEFAILKAASSNTKIIIDPIVDAAQTNQYYFNRTKIGRQHMQAIDKGTNDPVAEYDSLILIQEQHAGVHIPTIVEAKFLSEAAGKKPRREFKNTTINDKFKPIKEHFPNAGAFGYMVVTNPEQIRPQSQYQQILQKNGGYIVPFGFSSEEFMEEFNAWF
jgi:hypothetical protein